MGLFPLFSQNNANKRENVLRFFLTVHVAQIKRLIEEFVS